MFKNLEQLSNLIGISGFEESISEFIISKISNHCDYSIDNLGNIIAFKKGNTKPSNKIMLSAHMDEVGMIVTYVYDDGLIKFNCVGGINPSSIIGRPVMIGKNNIMGVVGSKPIHMMSHSDKSKAVNIDELYIDIGAKNAKQVYDIINLGDYISFYNKYFEFGNELICGKALDDRFGCAALIDIIVNSNLNYDCWFTFVVQEEIGTRGSKVAANTISPDIAIILESTTAFDISNVPNHNKVCLLGSGPAISFMDKFTIYNKNLYNLIFKIAKDNSFKIQTKAAISGGNDSGSIHLVHQGVATAAISIPCRYLHTSACVANKMDIYYAVELTKLTLDAAANANVYY